MLALTRKPGEQIVIGDDIIVTVVECKGENVRLAIQAPREVKIYRGEIYNEIVGENKRAANPGTPAQLQFLKEFTQKKGSEER